MLKHSSAELLRSPDKQCGSMCVFIEIEGGTILFMIYLYGIYKLRNPGGRRPAQPDAAAQTFAGRFL